MKTIKNWKQFNELNRSTYYNAAKQADELGDKKLGKKFRQHSSDIENLKRNNRINQSIKKYNLDEFSFKAYEYQFDGKFAGTDPGMEYEMFIDSDKKSINICPMFYMRGNDPNGKPFLGSFSPFWLTKDNDKTIVSGPFGIEETPYDKLFEEGGNNPLLFDNRKDANRFLNYLKNDILEQDYEDYFSKYVENEDDWKEFIDLRQELIENIKVRQLYRS